MQAEEGQSNKVLNEITELYRIHRPKTLKGVYGQDAAVKILSGFVAKNRIPRAVLFVGPSGCGKTTLARILAEKAGCAGIDFKEVNAAESRGIDMVRDIQNTMGYAPMAGKSRVWLVDECQKLTGDAQSAFLKILEDTPSHVHFFLATTDPNKLLKTIVTRCTEIRVSLLNPKSMVVLLGDVAKRAKIALSEEVRDKIVNVSEGSARKALVILSAVAGLDTEEEQLEAVQRSDSKQEAFLLCRALADPRSSWREVAHVLSTIEEEPEGMRRMVLGYFNAILLKGGANSPRAAFALDRFQAPFFDSGKAGLTLACYELCHFK